MCDHKNELPDRALGAVAGGAGSDGYFEVSIMIETDDKAAGFVTDAQQCAFSVSVRDRSRSVDAKDLSAVLSLDRSGFVSVFAHCTSSDPFVRALERYEIF